MGAEISSIHLTAVLQFTQQWVTDEFTNLNVTDKFTQLRVSYRFTQLRAVITWKQVGKTTWTWVGKIFPTWADEITPSIVVNCSRDIHHKLPVLGSKQAHRRVTVDCCKFTCNLHTSYSYLLRKKKHLNTINVNLMPCHIPNVSPHNEIMGRHHWCRVIDQCNHQYSYNISDIQWM